MEADFNLLSAALTNADVGTAGHAWMEVTKKIKVTDHLLSNLLKAGDIDQGLHDDLRQHNERAPTSLLLHFVRRQANFQRLRVALQKTGQAEASDALQRAEFFGATGEEKNDPRKEGNLPSSTADDTPSSIRSDSWSWSFFYEISQHIQNDPTILTDYQLTGIIIDFDLDVNEFVPLTDGSSAPAEAVGVRFFQAVQVWRRQNKDKLDDYSAIDYLIRTAKNRQLRRLEEVCLAQLGLGGKINLAGLPDKGQSKSLKVSQPTGKESVTGCPATPLHQGEMIKFDDSNEQPAGFEEDPEDGVYVDFECPGDYGDYEIMSFSSSQEHLPRGANRNEPPKRPPLQPSSKINPPVPAQRGRAKSLKLSPAVSGSPATASHEDAATGNIYDEVDFTDVDGRHETPAYLHLLSNPDPYGEEEDDYEIMSIPLPQEQSPGNPARPKPVPRPRKSETRERPTPQPRGRNILEEPIYYSKTKVSHFYILHGLHMYEQAMPLTDDMPQMRLPSLPPSRRESELLSTNRRMPETESLPSRSDCTQVTMSLQGGSMPLADPVQDRPRLPSPAIHGNTPFQISSPERQLSLATDGSLWFPQSLERQPLSYSLRRNKSSAGQDSQLPTDPSNRKDTMLPVRAHGPFPDGSKEPSHPSERQPSPLPRRGLEIRPLQDTKQPRHRSVSQPSPLPQRRCDPSPNRYIEFPTHPSVEEKLSYKLPQRRREHSPNRYTELPPHLSENPPCLLQQKRHELSPDRYTELPQHSSDNPLHLLQQRRHKLSPDQYTELPQHSSDNPTHLLQQRRPELSSDRYIELPSHPSRKQPCPADPLPQRKREPSPNRHFRQPSPPVDRPPSPTSWRSQASSNQSMTLPLETSTRRGKKVSKMIQCGDYLIVSRSYATASSNSSASNVTTKMTSDQ